jgi:hypothetical protein
MTDEKLRLSLIKQITETSDGKLLNKLKRVFDDEEARLQEEKKRKLEAKDEAIRQEILDQGLKTIQKKLDEFDYDINAVEGGYAIRLHSDRFPKTSRADRSEEDEGELFAQWIDENLGGIDDAGWYANIIYYEFETELTPEEFVAKLESCQNETWLNFVRRVPVVQLE